MYSKGTAYKYRRVYNFEICEKGNLFETSIKIYFPNVNGFERKNIFFSSKNPKLQKFLRDYNYFKKYATTFEALSFFIEILLKYPGKIFVRSNFFNKNFILVSKYKNKAKKISTKLIIIDNFIKKRKISFKENTEKEILEEIEKLEKYR
ncbi:hypothetical protein EOM09_02220 [bacterium]|nr:hypothetical protein [bacterium]